MARAHPRSLRMGLFFLFLGVWLGACGPAWPNGGARGKRAAYRPPEPATIYPCAGGAQASTTPGEAQPKNVAVNFAFATVNSRRGRGAQVYVRTQYELKQAELDSKGAALISLERSINESPPSEEKDERRKQWQLSADQLHAEVQQAQRHLEAAQERMLGPISDDAVEHATGFAKRMSAHVLYDESDDCRAADSQESRARCVAWAVDRDEATNEVEWCRPRLDLTANIMEALDATY